MQAEALLDHTAFVRELARSLTFGGEDPDDVVQQTWLNAMEHPPEAGPGMKGWLATVLRNVLRQDRRTRGRRVAREAVAPPPKEMPTPDEIREREAARSEVVTAVLELDEPYRDVILMRYYEDLPPRKIADRTGDPVETVKTRLVRARGRLRERLDDRHGGDGRTWGIAVASLALWPGEVRAAPASGASAPEKMRMTITSERPNASAVDYVDFDVDPESLVMTVFLAVGRHKMGFESAALRGELPPREVTGDGPTVDIVLTLERRTGVRLRLVDAEGRPLRRGPVRMLVILHVRSVGPSWDTNFSADSLGYHETDERGELDLTAILPALNAKSMHGNGFAFAFEAEGIFPGSMVQPNFEITVKEILALRERAAGGPVVIDAPALPHRVLTVEVRNADRETVSGVRVTGEPAAYFADTEYLSDADGRVSVRLVKVPDPFVRPPARPDRLRLVAKAPWIGTFDLAMLGMVEVPGGPQNALVVSRAVEIGLKLVNDGGEPIAWTEVTVDGAQGKTDAAGVVKSTAAAGAKQVEVKVPGHLPERVKFAGNGAETTVRLVRARKLRVRILMPDGSPTVRMPLIVRVIGEERRYGMIPGDPMEKVVVYLVPRRTVKVETYPQYPGITGSIEVGPEETEVELKLRKK